jgi:hypothetical protein
MEQPHSNQLSKKLRRSECKLLIFVDIDTGTFDETIASLDSTLYSFTSLSVVSNSGRADSHVTLVVGSTLIDTRQYRDCRVG